MTSLSFENDFTAVDFSSLSFRPHLRSNDLFTLGGASDTFITLVENGKAEIISWK